MEWKVGEYAIANLSNNKFEKIRIMKLRNLTNKEGKPIRQKMFYYVCVCDKKKYMWLSSDKIVEKQLRPKRPINKRRRSRHVLDDAEHLLPIDTQQASTSKPDLNVKFLQSHAAKVETGHDNVNEYLQFAMRAKDSLFADLYHQAENNIIPKSSNFNEIDEMSVSFEKKLEIITKPIVTKNEITAYLNQIWRFNVVHNSEHMRNGLPININLVGPDGKTNSSSHIYWCIVCGGVDNIQQCDNCPASYHPDCEFNWIIKMRSRDNKDSDLEDVRMPCIEDLIQSATTCPSCIYGPDITYGDIVWNKNSIYPWWPAKILKPGTIPPCLLKKCNTQGQWPVKYYNENKYGWVPASSICLFHPCHYDGSKSKCKFRDDAINEASHDYIFTYLI